MLPGAKIKLEPTRSNDDMVWQNAGNLFRGGTAEARKLKGKKVRLKRTLLNVPTVTSQGLPGTPIDLKAGTIGMVGYPDAAPDMITIAFPKATIVPDSLDRLMRGPFDAVRVTWKTFQERFEIET